MSPVIVTDGFSLTNRMLLYASVLLAPAQATSGWKNNCPSNLGFLAYNLYNQVLLNRAVQADNMHALGLTLPNLNLVFALSYFGGVTSGNLFMSGFLGFGTAAAMLLNNVTAWISWAKNQSKGIGLYCFFFFGHRTLSQGWHKFFLAWLIFDTFMTISLAGSAIICAFVICELSLEAGGDNNSPWERWVKTLKAIIPGALGMIVLAFPVILWIEMIVKDNEIVSHTDWVAVWLFIAQVVAMLLPPLCC